ncbi:hypothetical protein H4R23_005993 [Coemansia sp. Cherry 401B]|nr:hypothetical protein IWW54_002703 [Coemansia sp. RSA 2705]KAJ2713280.1 hypothetical protein H4R23_005993 [Coemansia sp. Cherry 401B]
MSSPGVLYYCPCSGCMGADAQPEEAHAGHALSDDGGQTDETHAEIAPPLDASRRPLTTLRTWPLEKLYYCDDCSQVRCPHCVIDEPAGYHCPNCLFDVPTASVRSEKNCCARNCFQCPVCTHVLAVVETESIQHSGGRTCFALACSVCLWDSREIAWEFEKPTGISAQIERARASQPAAREYASLLDHWRAVQRAASGATLPPAPAFKSRVQPAAGAAGLPSYIATCYTDPDREHMAALLAAKDATAVSSVDNMRRREPQRIRLHMKLARRCRTCHHILIKPESKAQATRFKIQLMAANFLPTITLPPMLPRTRAAAAAAPEPLNATPLRVGVTAPVVLRFANPLYTEMDVDVAVGRTDAALTDILAPQFTLPPFAEIWEYDEDEEDGGSPDSGPSTRRGIVHQHGNRIAIRLDVTPQAPADSLRLPLRITCTHMDDLADIDAPDLNASRRVVTNVVWAYVSLGTVN